jgi:adenylate kinase
MLNLVLFGPPGAGKGTQSEKLIAKYQLVHVSTGDLFRAHVKGETELGKKVSQLLADGELVPDAITIAMLEEEVDKNPDAKGFVFDGFPRTVPQAIELDLFLKRIAERHKTSGRPDDDAEKLKKRISEYFDKTIHVLPYYEEQGKLNKVNGIGEIETVYNDLCAVIDQYKV